MLKVDALYTITKFVFKGEAVRLARDFNYLCENEFPTAGCAEALTKGAAFNTPGSALARRNQLYAAR